MVGLQIALHSAPLQLLVPPETCVEQPQARLLKPKQPRVWAPQEVMATAAGLVMGRLMQRVMASPAPRTRTSAHLGLKELPPLALAKLL